MEKVPFYAIKGSPVHESPLGLFSPEEDGPILEEDYGIPRRYLQQHHVALGGEAAARIQRRHHQVHAWSSCYPSVLRPDRRRQDRAGRREQPGHLLAGRQGRHPQAGDAIAQNDPDAYSYSGGLCLANQGLLEFVEMFKAPIKVLHPLLTATQEGNYKGTEGFGAIPFDGIILAHSNESEWQAFKNNRNNEAFLDRIYIVKVPYCLRVIDEVKIYEKLLRQQLAGASALRARHPGDDGPVLGAVAPQGAGELQHLLQDAGLRRREPQGHRPQGQVATRNTATTPAWTRA